MSMGLARVTVSAPRRRLDVALPDQVPVAELLPELLRYAGVGLADAGERHGGWVLRRADGAALETGRPLSPQGVHDGDVLHLLPARTGWPEPEYDDVVEAIADGVRLRGAAWDAAASRTAGLVAAAAPATVGLLAVLDGGPGWAAGAPAALAAAGGLLLAAVAAARGYGAGAAGVTLGGYALPYAFAGGALLVASGDRAGPVVPVAWLGAPELLAGAATLLLAAVLAGVGVAAGTRIFAAGATVGLLGMAGALAGFALPAAGSAALLLSALVCGVGVAPLLAIRLGRLPLPPIVLPAEPTAADPPGGVRDLPRRDRVLAAVARTEELLSGMLLGHGLVAVAAVVLLVLAGGPAGRLLAAIGSAVLLLRCRIFASRRHRLPLLVTGLAGLVALGVAVAASTADAGRSVLLAAGASAALLLVVGGVAYPRRPPTPYLDRAADLADTLLVVSVVPVACAVLGLYGRARGLVG
ncbi:type VII secretion integral membrane protein EccD [Plantactinospora sp. KBS50]|uniref:type VII secretion integral membrane protein EccD n=1 Tax=Plantactinospora sp. KBS50 TaxID=2024580 RepID=UPI000BAAEA15|nr:type VII secretion integral membrane protein EccD [Plantactinospora sp. KBS50]ASW57034.1 type VII secretion integral membrane protein EccD [Plantactinospora sp. KBS50]